MDRSWTERSGIGRMKKIIVIGKMNKVTDELKELLSRDYHVYVVTDDIDVLPEIINIKKPDLIIVNLVGIYEDDIYMFALIDREFPYIPVLTVGTEAERSHLKDLYRGKCPDHILRPVTYSSITGAVQRTIGLSKDIPHDDPDPPVKEIEPVKKRVLVVDDNGHMLRTVKAMLEKDYEVELVRSGVKAMANLGIKRPDVLLLDYDMPVCDGRQTLEMIRAEKEYKDLPVIFVTGINDREHIRKVLMLNPQGYLLKPITQDALIAAIEKSVRESI